MVCEKCQDKLAKVITPDPWKSGARNTTEGGGRKVGENKALSASRRNRLSPYAGPSTPGVCKVFMKCRICKSSMYQAGSHYCQGCAYKKGICAMCGKQILDIKHYRQTAV